MRRPLLALFSSLLCSCAAIAAYDGSPAPGLEPQKAVVAARPTPPAPSAKPATLAAAKPMLPTTAHPRATLTKPTTSPREVLLRLHGSNTIGSELAPRLAEQFLTAMGATGAGRAAATGFCGSSPGAGEPS